MDALKGLLPSTTGLNTLRAKSEENVTAKVKEAGKDPQKIEKAATEFEALLLHQMLNSMWSTVPKDTLFGESQADELYRDMYSDAVAKSIAETQSIGIKEVVQKELSKK